MSNTTNIIGYGVIIQRTGQNIGPYLTMEDGLHNTLEAAFQEAEILNGDMGTRVRSIFSMDMHGNVRTEYNELAFDAELNKRERAEMSGEELAAADKDQAIIDSHNFQNGTTL